MNCALCGQPAGGSFPSWSRPVAFLGVRRYRRCASCKSMSLTPMPTDDELGSLYGSGYNATDDPMAALIDDPKETQWVVDQVANVGEGLFVDFGCGNGNLAAAVGRSGRPVLGVDVDAKALAIVTDATGIATATLSELEPYMGTVAAVHLGDVIEHLGAPDTTMQLVSRLLRPGGVVIAQGPLEANLCVFQVALRLSGWLRRAKPVTDPPYHVHLVTADGQRRFFSRTGFVESSYVVSEVAWPAPASRPPVAHRRAIALWFLRKVSQAVSAVAPNRLGNRYRYVGHIS